MRTNNKLSSGGAIGVATVGFFVIGIFVFVFVSILLNIVCNIAGVPGDTAQKNAEEWSKDLSLPVEHVKCNSVDTDGDGYISCAFKMKSGTVESYECSAWTSNDGCRPPKLITR